MPADPEPAGQRPAQATTPEYWANSGLSEDVPVELQEEELDEFRFVEPTALDDYLPAIIGTRVAAAIRGRNDGTTAYLPWIEPSARRDGSASAGG